jgi:hypothetical protein
MASKLETCLVSVATPYSRSRAHPSHGLFSDAGLCSYWVVSMAKLPRLQKIAVYLID